MLAVDGDKTDTLFVSTFDVFITNVVHGWQLLEVNQVRVNEVPEKIIFSSVSLEMKKNSATNCFFVFHKLALQYLYRCGEFLISSEERLVFCAETKAVCRNCYTGGCHGVDCSIKSKTYNGSSKNGQLNQQSVSNFYVKTALILTLKILNT